MFDKWGELIIPNIIRSSEGKIILCDTETIYYRGTIIEQKVSDWLDFICSTCGAMSKLHSEKFYDLIPMIFSEIENKKVKSVLKDRCGEKKTLLHKLFFAYTWARLQCSPNLYDEIKHEVHWLL